MNNNDYASKINNIMDKAKEDVRTQIDRAYQKGYEDAKSELGQNAIDLAHEESDRAYQQGLEDAWEAAKKIVHEEGLSIQELAQIFGTGSYSIVLEENTASEAIAKIKEYEEQQKQDTIQVGDEVVLNILADHENQKAIIIACIGTSYPYNVLMDNGDSEWVKEIAIECKTGRHFDQIAEVLAELRGESE